MAVGERVLLRRNDRRLGVVNGDRGVVVGAKGTSWSSNSAGGPCASVASTSTRSAALELGYAITGHAAQGLTCSQTFVLATDGLSKEWAYVALSRGRDSNRLVRDPRGSRERGVRAERRWHMAAGGGAAGGIDPVRRARAGDRETASGTDLSANAPQREKALKV